MKVRAVLVTAALLATSYGVLAGHHTAAAETVATDPPDSVVAADTRTTLPNGRVADVVVDDVHRQVFVSMPSINSVVVVNFSGQITGTVTGLTSPGEMVLSGDAGTVYVIEGGAHSIGRIDTATYQVGHASVPTTDCPESVTFTGGKLWYAYEICANTVEGGVGTYDPATDTVTAGVLPVAGGIVRALPDRADRLVALNSSQFAVYDVSGTEPVVVVQRGAGAGGGAWDAALTPDAGTVVIARTHTYQQHEVLRTADLTALPAIPSGSSPNAVAISADGGHVAAGNYDQGEADVFVRAIGGGTPGTFVRDYHLGERTWLPYDALAFSSTGTLYAAEHTYGAPVLHGLADAVKIPTSITVTAPKAVKYKGTISATGTLSNAPDGAAVALTRTDRSGSRDLGTLPVAADGGFSFSDTPTVTGPVTYTLRYAGDDTHTAAEHVTTVVIRPLPYDVNADGHADVIVGAPGEDVGSVSDAGLFHLLYGRSTGVTGSGSLAIDQNTAGVPGSAESGDLFGWSNSSGDFNGDGYADVAVSAGSENVGSIRDSGVVLVFYGSGNGLRTDNVKSLTLENTFLSDAAGVYFGDALASGDFNGDGRDDLAIGAAGAGAGYVFVATGTAGGLSAELTSYSQDTWDVPGYSYEDDLFGWSVAAGDINGDGRADLAVGAIYDWEDRDWSTGSVTVLYGSATGLTGTGSQRFTKDTAGVPGSGGSFNPDTGDDSDDFGFQVVLADFNGDGKADLAAAAPGAPVTGTDGARKADAGTVTVLYSTGTRLGTTNATQVTQATSGMPGSPGSNDYLGYTLAGGDSNGDGRAELAIFSPGDTYVTVVPGSSTGLKYGSAKGWTQNSSGIPGSTESGDYWGNSLRFADVKGTGRASLIVGADGENNDQGAVTVIHSTSSGLTGTGAQALSQNTTGVPGTPENGDGFGVFF